MLVEGLLCARTLFWKTKQIKISALRASILIRENKDLCDTYTCTHVFGDWFVCMASLVAQRLKCLPAMQETWVRSLGREDPLEKEVATHSSILAWRIPWMKEPGGLQSTGSHRVRHDWATSLSLLCEWVQINTFTFTFVCVCKSTLSLSCACVWIDTSTSTFVCMGVK